MKTITAGELRDAVEDIIAQYGEDKPVVSDVEAFERRVTEALRVVGLVRPADWRWLRGGRAVLVFHDRSPFGLKLAEEATLALSAYMNVEDGDAEEERARGGTRFTWKIKR